uniref:DDB1-and CUL4-associated factor 7 n=1 Tax=Naja naja TaxID=35670 RepID=A0A8C6XL41_NAJNA
MSLHGKRKEIYKYEAPWTVYAMNWSVRPDKRFRLALGSFVEEYNNKVQLVGLDEESSEFICRNTFDHPYPTTKLMWIPDTKGVYPDLLATSGDYLRVWRMRPLGDGSSNKSFRNVPVRTSLNPPEENPAMVCPILTCRCLTRENGHWLLKCHFAL